MKLTYRKLVGVWYKRRSLEKAVETYLNLLQMEQNPEHNHRQYRMLKNVLEYVIVTKESKLFLFNLNKLMEQ